MHFSAKLACASMAVLLAGCSSFTMPSFSLPTSWNPFADKPKFPPVPLITFKETMAVSKAWTVSIGSSGAYTFSPAYAKDSVYAASADGAVVRLDAATGKQVWRRDAGRLSGGVGTDGDTVAVAADNGEVIAYDSEGKLRWKMQTSSEVLSAPAVGEGLVVVRSVDNRIIALDALNGARKWATQRPAPTLTLRNAPGIVIANQTAYVAMPGGKLLALAMNNGGLRWEATVGESRGATELERLVDTSGNPVLIGGEVCAASYHGRAGCFVAATGAPRWLKDLSSDAGIAADERFAFAADENGAVNAFVRETGASAWRSDKLAYRRLSTPASFGRAVAVGDYQGYIHFLSREDGAMLARVTTDGSPIRSVPLVTGKHLIFQTQAGSLVALAAE
ncbi:MAG TPA: outer membrane protein assembly factor BamB [Burkholderiaceae bacterium]